MKVWVMNLKDNREEKTEPDKSKFDFCMEKGIVGIGWAGCSSKNSADAAFLQSEAYLKEFKPGDIAWTKNPESGEQYICRILSAATETDDPEYNKYDISRYCACTFEKAGNLPEDIQEEDLISISAISPANQRLCESTGKYFRSDNKSGRKGIKIAAIVTLVAVICASAVFAAFSVAGAVTRKKHPILPYDIKFGDTYEKAAEKAPDDFFITPDDETAYNKTTKTYYYLLDTSNINDFFADKMPCECSLFDLKFNESKELYSATLTVKESDVEKIDEYILNGVADERVIADDGTFRSVSAEYMGNDITISRMGTFFIITSEEYEPVYHEVPDADYKYYSLSSRPDIIEVPDDYEYIDYLSTSYVVEIKGDISPNPDIPYYVSEETDIAKVLLVFNEYDELLDHRIFDVCSQLNSYAVIYMTR